MSLAMAPSRRSSPVSLTVRLNSGRRFRLNSIFMYPGAYVLEGYANSMPNHYSQRLSQQEIGHIIAYLLTAADEAGDSQN